MCVYQKKPTVLVVGWLSHLWDLLQHLREKVEILQAPTMEKMEYMLTQPAVPDLIIVEISLFDLKDVTLVSSLARQRTVPWAAASGESSSEQEVLCAPVCAHVLHLHWYVCACLL